MSPEGTKLGPNETARLQQIYDEQRLCLLYKQYFERKTSSLQLRLLVLDVAIVIGTSTTGIAGWTLWSQPVFAPTWAILAGVAVTLALIKPILRLDENLLQYNKLFTIYSRQFRKYSKIVNDIAYRVSLTNSIQERYNRLSKDGDDIDEVPMDKKLLARLVHHVNKELPVDQYWWPPA